MVNVRILKTIHFERWEESPAEGLCHEVPIGLPLNAARAGQLPQGLLMAPDYIWYLQMCWKYEAIWVWVWVKITKTCFFPDLRSKGIPWETYTKFLSIFFFAGSRLGIIMLWQPLCCVPTFHSMRKKRWLKREPRVFLTGFSMQATHLHEIDRYELIDMIWCDVMWYDMINVPLDGIKVRVTWRPNWHPSWRCMVNRYRSDVDTLHLIWTNTDCLIH